MDPLLSYTPRGVAVQTYTLPYLPYSPYSPLKVINNINYTEIAR